MHIYIYSMLYKVKKKTSKIYKDYIIYQNTFFYNTFIKIYI